MTDRYFADYQSEMSSIIYSKDSNGVSMSMNQKDVDRGSHSEDNTADWIAMPELSGKVNNRKNGHGRRRLVSTLRQLKQKYLTPMENVTEDDNSGLLADSDADDDDSASIWVSHVTLAWGMFTRVSRLQLQLLSYI